MLMLPYAWAAILRIALMLLQGTDGWVSWNSLERRPTNSPICKYLMAVGSPSAEDSPEPVSVLASVPAPAPASVPASVSVSVPASMAASTADSMRAIEEIRFRDAVFSYPGSDVTYHFDYRFTSGRKYLVVGENGIGKTTMIRMLAGLCPLQRGEILANGTLNINGMCEAAKRAKIAVLPQDVVPFEGVLSLGPTEPVGPAGGLDDSGSTASFSGGQKKMAFLSSVFASQADVTILDEPYAELDAAAKESVTGFINESSLNKIVIVVSHEIPSGLDMHNAEMVRLRRDGNTVVMHNAI
jgi:ABC-type transport system involved in cytochrome bd biosynthesis fused ATPase/permease subunit